MLTPGSRNHDSACARPWSCGHCFAKLTQRQEGVPCKTTPARGSFSSVLGPGGILAVLLKAPATSATRPKFAPESPDIEDLLTPRHSECVPSWVKGHQLETQNHNSKSQEMES